MRVLYAQAVYGQEEIDAVVDVLRNSSLSLMNGSRVHDFEARVATLFAKRFGVMVNSGSSANTLAVASLDLAPGSEIITPALTFSTTVAPIVQQGLVPAFVDVEEDTYVIDASRVEEMVGPQTKAIMIPNLMGNLPDWPALRDIAERHGLAVIEDSCDTLGSLCRGRPTGDLTDISTASFYASHVITAAGFGGMVCFNAPGLAERATLLRGWGRGSSLTGESESMEDRFQARVDGIEYDSKFLFEDIGYNFLPSEMAAAFGLVQLRKLKDYIAKRSRNFNLLTTFFRDFEDWLILPRQTEDTETAWLAVPLTVRDDAPFSRRELQIHFESNGIQTRTVFTGNILRQPGFRDIQRKESPQGFANADRVMRGGILLGCHQGMDDGQVESIRECFRDFARKFRPQA